MTLRERLEQIIRKYQLSYNWVAEANTESRLGYSSNTPPPGLLDDLVVLYPQPSREEVEKIVMTYSLPHHTAPKTPHEFFEGTCADCSKEQALVEKLMVWAQGQEAPKLQVGPPYWCDHVLWTWYGKSSGKEGQGYWSYKNKSPYGENIASDWQQCPVCGAKRPHDS